MPKKILTAWCEFLSSADSRVCDQRFPIGGNSAAAVRAIGIEAFAHDPDDEHWGLASWNYSFTRRLKDGARPVASPDDDSVIVSACESTPDRIATDVDRQDRFWIKSQPYSLQDMLANDESVDQFVGGTVYQAYLSATNYHRWHSPVAGTIVRAFLKDGTYYSEADSEGADAVEPTNSQPYLKHVAARAIILIQADDPVIGLVAVMPVGMVEVSSCIIDPNVTPGYHLTKGEELGYFQFGGSTQCLVFRPGVIADVTSTAIPRPHDADPDAPLVQVRSALAAAHTTTRAEPRPSHPDQAPATLPCGRVHAQVSYTSRAPGRDRSAAGGPYRHLRVTFGMRLFAQANVRARLPRWAAGAGVA
jgi:phosphatidylserine decarboxylase